jgi:hypothetical protein
MLPISVCDPIPGFLDTHPHARTSCPSPPSPGHIVMVLVEQHVCCRNVCQLRFHITSRSDAQLLKHNAGETSTCIVHLANYRYRSLAPPTHVVSAGLQ